MVPTPIETVLSRPANALPPTALASEAARRLRDPDVPAVVVLDEETDDGAGVAGIVTESDLVALVAEACEDVPITAVMSAPVVTLSPNTSVREATDRMSEPGARHLPVVEDGVYRGIVTVESLAPHVSRHRLDVEWRGEPLSVEDTDAPEAQVAE